MDNNRTLEYAIRHAERRPHKDDPARFVKNLKKENIKAVTIGAIAYIVIAIFLLVTGWFFLNRNMAPQLLNWIRTGLKM